METKVAFLEPEINKEASRYIENNFDNLVKYAMKLGVHKAEDLVQDVCVSIIQAEYDGAGYNMNNKVDGGCILVSQFVRGRIKGYSKNVKYRTDVIEARNNKGVGGKVRVRASDFNDTLEIEELNAFQKAYALAGSYDDIEEIDDRLSVIDKINYCMEFDDITNIKIVELFKNIDKLKMLEEKIQKSLFGDLGRALRYHDEFGEAFRDVFNYAIKHKDRFELIINNI